MQVLAADLASKHPRDLGLAVLRNGTRVRAVFVPPEELGLAAPLEVDSLAEALSSLAQRYDCAWIALDGPAGWKHPDNGLVHSRVADRELNAPAKVGLPGQVKPRSYAGFVDFSIRLFDALAERGYGRLSGFAAPSAALTAIEVFPLCCWPRLRLPRLPAKARCKAESLHACRAALSSLIDLASAPNHDELQAAVAGLSVLRLAAGRHDLVHLAGVAPVWFQGFWREGFIVAPSTGVRGDA